MNMGNNNNINVFSLVIFVILYIVENSNANGKYDLYITFKLKYIIHIIV